MQQSSTYLSVSRVEATRGLDILKLACALAAVLLVDAAIADRNVMGVPALPQRQERRFDFPTVTSEAADEFLTAVVVLFIGGLAVAFALWWSKGGYLKETIVSLKPLCEIPDDEDAKNET